MAQLGLNEVWRETTGRVERQAGVLFTVGAAFLLLPAATLFLLAPEGLTAGRTPFELTPEMQRLALPVACATLFQLFGQLSIMAIATDGGRSTVSIAMHRAFSALPRILLAVLILAAAAMALIFIAALVAVIPVMIANGSAAIDPRRVSSILALAILIPFFYLGLRFSLFSVATVVDRASAVGSLRASWHATRGHILSIALILVISLIGMLALQGLVGLIVGGAARLMDAMTGGSGVPQFVANVAGATVGAVASVYFTMLIVVIYRRLTATS